MDLLDHHLLLITYPSILQSHFSKISIVLISNSKEKKSNYHHIRASVCTLISQIFSIVYNQPNGIVTLLPYPQQNE